MNKTLYEISIKKTNGQIAPLSQYAGKVLLIVNTATRCGLAPQFEALEELYQTYSHDDFMVLGFPCDQFAGQEPETDETVEQVCKINF
jgi:glutathione peroxidase